MCSVGVAVYCILCFFFFKQKTAYEMRISDWSSDVCSSDLVEVWDRPRILLVATGDEILAPGCATRMPNAIPDSLSLALEQLCASAGANVVAALRLPDNERAIADAQQEAFADVVVVIGGASRGARDFGRSAFALLGLDIAFAG